MLGLLATTTFAIEIPKSVRDFLLSRNQKELVEKFEAIKRVSPEEFVKIFGAEETKLIGTGWNGAAFKNANDQAYKFSHAVFGSPGVVERWATIKETAVIKPYTNIGPDQQYGINFPVHKLINFLDIGTLKPGEKELLGTLLWVAYFPEAIDALPDLIATDGFAYRRSFVPGTPLDKVLHAKPDATTKWNMQKIWKEIIRYQNEAEKMLFDSGVMVDLLNPANFIVQGTPEDPKLVLVDHEFVVPTAQVYEYYAARGHTVPKYDMVSQYRLIRWPLMPDHIIQSKLWSLTFEQAVDYMMARYEFPSREQAIYEMSHMPVWKNELLPLQEDHSNIQRAHELYPAICEILFTKP